VIDFFFDYGLFLLKTVTIVIAIAAVVLIVFVLPRKKHAHEKDSIEIKPLNKKFENMAMAINVNILEKQALKKYLKQEKEKHKSKAKDKKEDQKKKRIYVLNFHGDIRASAVSSLREEITAILMVASQDDEVFIRLESGGGVVHGYGLAASQLMRIREKNIHLTVAVDKVAASGGYMMACVGSHIIAAPFAIVGSIGVIAQIPNFNKVLKKHDIEYDQFTAGEFKRTVTMFGENTDEGRKKFHEEIEDVHLLFKDFIVKNRPDIDITKVATGESWLGTRALENNLVDELKTSDDYLLENSKTADIFELNYIAKKSLMEKFGFNMRLLLDKWLYSGI